MREEAGWWVLAVGGPYDAEDFDQRDAARTRLRQELLLVAIVPGPVTKTV